MHEGLGAADHHDDETSYTALSIQRCRCMWSCSFKTNSC